MTRRVGVNLLWLVPGVVGGSEHATVRYLRALDAASAELELTLFVLPSFLVTYPDLAGRFPVVVAPVDGSSKSRRVLAESRWLPRAAGAAGTDLVHHAGGVVPPRWRGRSTLTIHDVQPLDLPGNFGLAKRAYLRGSLAPSVRRAGLVVVPGEFTRGRVIDRLGAEPDAVVVVPWSVDLPSETLDGSPLERGGGSGLADVPVGVPFVLYPAITYPHKNHGVLLDAFARIPDRNLHLVLPGGVGPAESSVRQQIDRLGLSSRVHRLGLIPAAELDELYRRAMLVAVPSRYEGFGLPALEAMAYGRPVVAAGNTALVDVVAPGTPLLDPDDVEGWAETISSLAADGAARAACGAAGKAHAATFTSERTATGMVDVWQRVLRNVEPDRTA